MTTTLRVRSLLTVLVLALGTAVGTATAAHAHTQLASSDPVDGGTVTGPLSAVQLTFTGQIISGEVTVTGPAGTGAGTGPADVAGAVVTQAVELTEAGEYTVDYTVTAGDGHPLSGTLTFSYAPPTPEASPTASPETSPTAFPEASPTASPAAGASEASAGSRPPSDGGSAWLWAAAAVVVAGAALLIARWLRGRPGRGSA